MHEVLNLLPWRSAYQRRCLQRLWALVGVFIMVCVLSVSLPLMWLRQETLSLNHAQAQWHQQAMAMQPIYQNWQASSHDDRQIKQDFNDLSQRIRRHNQVVLVMNQMPLLIPQGAHLTTIRWGKQQIEVVGISDNKAALGQLVSAFQTVKAFKHVSLSSVTVTKHQPIKHQFTLNVEWLEEIGDERP